MTQEESIAARYGQVVLLQALQRFIGVRVAILPSLELQQGFAELAREIEAKAPDYVPMDDVDPGLMMNPFDSVLAAIQNLRDLLLRGAEEFHALLKLQERVESVSSKGVTIKAIEEQREQIRKMNQNLPSWNKHLLDVLPKKRWCHDEGVLEDLVLFAELLFPDDDILKEGGTGCKVLHICFGRGEGYDLFKNLLQKVDRRLVELEELHKYHSDTLTRAQKKQDELNFRSAANELSKLKPRPFTDIHYSEVEERNREFESRVEAIKEAWKGFESKLLREVEFTGGWIKRLFDLQRRIRLCHHTISSADRWVQDREVEVRQIPASELRDDMRQALLHSEEELYYWRSRVSYWIRKSIFQLGAFIFVGLFLLGGLIWGGVKAGDWMESLQADTTKRGGITFGYLAVQCRSSLEMKIRSIQIFSKGKNVAEFKPDISADKIPFKPIPSGINSVYLQTSMSPVVGMVLVPEQKRMLVDLTPWSNPDASKEITITGVPEGAIIICNDVEINSDIRKLRLIYGRHRLGCRVPGLIEGDQPLIVADDTPAEINLGIPVVSMQFNTSPDLQIFENGKEVKDKLRHFSTSGQHVIAVMKKGKNLGLFQFESKPGQQLGVSIRPGVNEPLELEVVEQ